MSSPARRIPGGLLAAAALLLCSGMFCRACAAGPEPGGGALAGERPRVLVSSDIGGSDPDDFQSAVHLLFYADVLDIEGLVASPPGEGRAAHWHEVIAAYAEDYPRLRRHCPRYPAPDALRALVRQGAVDPAPPEGFSAPTDGSQLLVERARAEAPRPLWVLVWGSITDVAQAVHDAPDIADRIRIVSIGSWNTSQDRAARDYLFRQHPGLWWVESDSTFRGMYVGGDQAGDLENRAFLDAHARGHGALGDFLVGKMDHIKMGDTPSLLYLLAGDPDDPAGPHWGGSFPATDHGPRYWTDSPDPALAEGRYPGAKTVNRWRAAFLRDWAARMDRARE